MTKITDVTICRGGNGRKRAAHERTINSIDDAADLSIEWCEPGAFGSRNMGVAPAGSDRENSGHHHLLIDTPLPPLNKPIPNDFNHLHFGSGQTEAEYQSSHWVTDCCPIALRDGHDLPRLVDECVPSVAAVVDDIVEGFENSVRQPILTHERHDAPRAVRPSSRTAFSLAPVLGMSASRRRSRR